MTYRNDVGGFDLDDEPQEVEREARTRRALDCLMCFALGAACSLSAVLIALDIASR